MNTIFSLIGVGTVLFGLGVFLGGHWRDDQYKAAYERQVAALQAANQATEADRNRLSGELQQSEAQIDKWKKEYDDAIAKVSTGACLLSDDDVAWLQHPGAARPKSKNK